MNIFHRNQGRQFNSSPAVAVKLVQKTPTQQPQLKSRSTRDDDRTKKNRKIINSFLKHVGVGKQELSLCGKKGMCSFRYKQFLIVIEVPQGSESVFVYTMVFGLAPKDNRFAILQQSMQLNYMTQGTQGSTLGLDGDEVNLCCSFRVCGSSRESFVEDLETFMATAVDVNRRLDLVK